MPARAEWARKAQKEKEKERQKEEREKKGHQNLTTQWQSSTDRMHKRMNDVVSHLWTTFFLILMTCSNSPANINTKKRRREKKRSINTGRTPPHIQVSINMIGATFCCSKVMRIHHPHTLRHTREKCMKGYVFPLTRCCPKRGWLLVFPRWFWHPPSPIL